MPKFFLRLTTIFKKTIHTYKYVLILASISTVLLVSYQNCGSSMTALQKEVLVASETPIVPEPPLNCAQAQGSNLGEILHGNTIVAYQASSVAFDQICRAEPRGCNNGILSGSFLHSSCSPATAKNCVQERDSNLGLVAHGQSVQAFPSPSVPSGKTCISEERLCTDGILSGANKFANCKVENPPDPTMQSCPQEPGSNLGLVEHGQSVLAYPAPSAPYGQKCGLFEERRCFNGVLTGTNKFASCKPGEPIACAQELGSDLGEVAHGDSIIAFPSSVVAANLFCEGKIRTCNNGLLDGPPYLNVQCRRKCPSPFVGVDVDPGASVVAYKTSSVPPGQSCDTANNRETRTCDLNGTGFLSGSFINPNCVIAEPDCTNSLPVLKVTLTSPSLIISDHAVEYPQVWDIKAEIEIENSACWSFVIQDFDVGPNPSGSSGLFDAATGEPYPGQFQNQFGQLAIADEFGEYKKILLTQYHSYFFNREGNFNIEGEYNLIRKNGTKTARAKFESKNILVREKCHDELNAFIMRSTDNGQPDFPILIGPLIFHGKYTLESPYRGEFVDRYFISYNYPGRPSLLAELPVGGGGFVYFKRDTCERALAEHPLCYPDVVRYIEERGQKVSKIVGGSKSTFAGNDTNGRPIYRRSYALDVSRSGGGTSSIEVSSDDRCENIASP